MKINNVRIENFMGIEVVELDDLTHKKLIEVTGKNGAGKSSIFEALKVLIGGDRLLPELPIRRGSDIATIKCSITGYTIEKKIDSDGKTTLTLRDENNKAVTSPQTALNKIISANSFNPDLLFTAKPLDQSIMILKALGIDYDLQNHVNVRKSLYQSRQDQYGVMNRALRLWEAIEIPPNTPEKPINPTEIKETLEQVRAKKRALETVELEHKRLMSSIATQEDIIKSNLTRIESLKNEILRLEQDNVSIETTIAALKAESESVNNNQETIDFLSGNEKTLSNTLAEIFDINARVKIRDDKLRAKLEYDNELSKYDSFTRDIERLDNTLIGTIATAESKFPLPNLSINGEGELRLNKVPIEQCSAAEKIKISLAVALMLNPQLKTIFIKDASLLDEDSLAVIKKFAEDKDYQIFVETVVARSDDAILIVGGNNV